MISIGTAAKNRMIEYRNIASSVEFELVDLYPLLQLLNNGLNAAPYQINGNDH